MSNNFENYLEIDTISIYVKMSKFFENTFELSSKN